MPATVRRRSDREPDRSVPRHAHLAGEGRRDGRGRSRAAPPILHYGFRPFFLLGAIYAAAAVPLWLWFHATGQAPAGPFSGLAWHVHEMLFGYLAAVMAGFVLTAVPNWTGGLPLSGAPLALLVGLWITGRLAVALVAWQLAAVVLDLLFPAALAAAVWREIAAGRNWRNLPVAAMLTLFALANALHHAEAAGLAPEGLATRLALAVAAMLMTLIGGRIVPSFTRNWLARRPGSPLPAPFGRLDRMALLLTAAGLALWVAAPHHPLSGAALLSAGAFNAVRLARWKGWLSAAEPIVLVLHAGYGWLALALLLMGAGILWPFAVPQGAAVHALTAGAVATMTLAVMTRASLGHTGRAIAADRWIGLIYLAVTAGALLRVATSFLPAHDLFLLAAAGALWSGAFALFALRYWRVLTGPRL